MACGAVLFFGLRLVVFGMHWSDPANRNQPIAGWMSPGYVAMSWHVPKPVVMEALGLEEKSRDRKSLDDLARERGLPVDVLIRELEDAIALHRQVDR